MTAITFAFTAANQSTPAMAGTNGYLKTKDVSRDTFYVLLDETSNLTAGGIELVARTKVGSTTYTALAGLMETKGIFAFVVHPNCEYFLRTNATFSGSVTGVLSEGSELKGN